MQVETIRLEINCTVVRSGGANPFLSAVSEFKVLKIRFFPEVAAKNQDCYLNDFVLRRHGFAQNRSCDTWSNEFGLVSCEFSDEKTTERERNLAGGDRNVEIAFSKNKISQAVKKTGPLD